jgi:hypothetical protein
MKVTVAALVSRMLEGILEALYEKLRKSMSNRWLLQLILRDTIEDTAM